MVTSNKNDLKKQIYLKSITTFFFVSILFILSSTCFSQDRFPGKTWMQFAKPQLAGWSNEKLKGAKAFADSIGSAAFMLIYDGAVVTTWGDIERRYMCHSVRKSFLSALYGVHVGDGNIDVNNTLADLNIDDKDILTPVEKQAKILDLLKARSGIYHPAAYETAGMKRIRPKRGSHIPGTFWYYNNWDFNTLGFIFEKETGKKIFEEFDNRIGKEIQMQDYRDRDGYYHLEPENSNYRAYPFRMSARDMARFGLLYLNNGNWKGKQIIPSSWVKETSTSYSKARSDDGYGYMWWILGGELKQYGAYTAYGVGTQTITVIPGLNIVFVHRVDTYIGDRIPTRRILQLLKRLIDAKTSDGSDHPTLTQLPKMPPRAETVKLSSTVLKRYAKTYTYPSGRSGQVKLTHGGLIATVDGFGTFGLEPLSETEFLMEDVLDHVFFRSSTDDSSPGLISENFINAEGYFLLRQEKIPKAIEIFKLNVVYYPESFNVYDSLAEAYMANDDKELSVKNYKRSLKLNPGNNNAVEMLKKLKDM